MTPRYFFLGLWFLSLISLGFNFYTDSYAILNISFTLDRVAIPIVVGLISGLIVWASFAYFQGVEDAPDPRTVMLCVAAVVVGLFMAPRFFEEPLSEAQRLALSDDLRERCVQVQQSNYRASESQRHEYCSCIASSLGETLSSQDLKQVATHKKFIGPVGKKMQNAVVACAKKLLGE